jgi:uncharacterized phage protein (TIGR02220 family)
MNYFSVKNLEKYQHYHDRNPPWIKLHRTILDDYEFSCLQDASKLLQILIWVLASQMGNRVPADENWLKGKLGLKGKADLKPLIESGFIVMEQVDSNVLADCKQNGGTETELRQSRDRVETETYRGRASKIILYLNEKASKKFKPMGGSTKQILARLEEGYEDKDFYYVIDNRIAHWKGKTFDSGKPAEDYLRPSTLFNQEKFANYLGSQMPKDMTIEKNTKQIRNLKTIEEWSKEEDGKGNIQGGDGNTNAMRIG